MTRIGIPALALGAVLCLISRGEDLGRAQALTVKVVGYNKVELTTTVTGTIKRQEIEGRRAQYGLTAEDYDGRVIAAEPAHPIIDNVPVSLAEARYRYSIVVGEGRVLATAETSRVWPERLFPRLILPGRKNWVALYRKAWELTWRRIVTSKNVPARFAYNDYPDNGTSYQWDSCFCSLFQRYAALSGAHPGMANLDNFYAQQQPSGYICRTYHSSTYEPRAGCLKEIPSFHGVNPPLFAWAEWNYFLISGDQVRLRRVLPKLVKYYDFFESFMQEEPGKYVWTDGGWDNVSEGEEQETKYWVEIPAMQALAAADIGRIARVLGQGEVERRFAGEVAKKRAEIERYWNREKDWYCGLDRAGRFTGKTLNGVWPVLAGLVPRDRLRLMVRGNLMNPSRFLTSPMPLPTVAKDEKGYNPKGAYWLGAAWINISLMVVRALDESGYSSEASELAARTLDGMARTYNEWLPEPNTLWEAYAPEYPAPASHKVAPELGSVRGDFGGWACCLINLLMENVMGIEVDAPANTVTWSLRLDEENGIEGLRFGATTTDLIRRGPVLHVRADAPYTLKVISHGKTKSFEVGVGPNRFGI